MKNRRVVVTGGGIISALGNNWNEAYKSLKAGKNFVKYMDEWAEKYPLMNTRLAVPIEFEIDTEKYPRKKIRGMGRVAQMALVATDAALEDAGISQDDPIFQSGRMGIAYGSSMGSVMPLMDYFSMLITNDTSKIGATTYIKCMPQTCAANLEVYYQLKTTIITTNTAFTSGTQSTDYASDSMPSAM